MISASIVRPAPFSATEINLNGKRAIRLVAKDFKQAPKIINLVVQQQLPGFTRFPAAFEYIDTPLGSVLDMRGPRQTTIRIVAAPGVSVHLESWPDMSETLLDVIRVQDPEVVPPQATSILSGHYMPPPEVNSPPFFLAPTEQANSVQYPTDYFVLDQESSRLIITHHYSTFSLTLDYPVASRSLTDLQDAEARFCYQVLPLPGQNPAQQRRFTIVKTPNIKATLRGGPPQITEFEHLYNIEQYLIPFKIYDAPDITSVPPQGADIVPRPGWQDDTAIKVIGGLIDDDTETLYRVVLSFIPIASDIIDVAEFLLATGTGKDFLGRQVTDVEKVLLGLNVIISALPISIPATLKVFKRKVNVAIMLREAVQGANVTPEERALIQEAEETIKKGRKTTKEQLEALSNVLKRMPNEYPPIELLLNADGRGFSHAELQQGYQAYEAEKLKLNKEPLSPKDWALANTTGKYSDILVKILGPGYRKAAVGAASGSTQRMFSLINIMKPLGYTDEQIREHLAFVLAQGAKLEERLKPLLADLRSADEVVAYMARNQMSKQRFNHVKGIIGEIFALPIQRKVLEESYPNGLIFTGVQMKRVSGKKAVYFTDNIIAIHTGNDIKLQVVFEVKSGDRGGAEATTQIFQWIEERLEVGDQLIIPAGSKYYNAQGAELTLAKDIRATYGSQPSADKINAGVGMVYGLANADRKIVAAKGTSLLGLNSEDQAPVIIDRLELPLTSSQIDYLGGQLVQALGQFPRTGVP